jgi:hypothetical protein
MIQKPQEEQFGAAHYMDHLLICITINHGVISMMMDTIRNCSIITLIILVSVRTFAPLLFYHNPLRREFR